MPVNQKAAAVNQTSVSSSPVRGAEIPTAITPAVHFVDMRLSVRNPLWMAWFKVLSPSGFGIAAVMYAHPARCGDAVQRSDRLRALTSAEIFGTPTAPSATLFN